MTCLMIIGTMELMLRFLRLLASIAICEGAGIIGAFFTAPAIPTWYASLQKPSFAPPDFVFGPVWIILYLLMGISLYLVWQGKRVKGKGDRLRERGLQAFAVQLGLNILWSVVFFGYQSPLGALVVIIGLLALIYRTIVYFQRVSTPAALLLYPYLAWVGFAAILNFYIWILNR